MSRYKIIKYQHPINFDGQSVPLSLFSNKKDLIGKIITITVSDLGKEELDLVDEPNVINKPEQHIYATRREEIFVRIVNIFHDCKARVEVMSNPYVNYNSNALFFVHDTRSTPFYEHSKCITTFINDGITMSSDLLSYFKYAPLVDDFGMHVSEDRDWIDQSFFDCVQKVPTIEDLKILDKLQRKNILTQQLYSKYVNHYIPLSNIQEKIFAVIDARQCPKYETHPYYPAFDQYRSRLSKNYSSYGHTNHHTESRYLKEGDQIDIIFENIHYYPLGKNNMSDHKEYEYKFGRIPVPMAWSGALFEDPNGILSMLQVGNIVRCHFQKLELKSNRNSCGGGAWYFSILLVHEDIIFGSLKDIFYDPKEHNLNAGDILIFKKLNITEIPHDWPENKNLSHFTTSRNGYLIKGCVCDFMKNSNESDDS